MCVTGKNIEILFKGEVAPAFAFAPPPAGFQVKRLAIVKFLNKMMNPPSQGAAEDSAIKLLSSLMTNSKRFQVIEQEKVNTLLKEQGFADKADIDSDTAAQIGKDLGAELRGELVRRPHDYPGGQ